MALNTYNIKKWYLMLTGQSILHVNQGIGRYFSTTELKGYYNNMTEKVSRLPELLCSDELPLTPDEKGGQVYFPVAIFQYGLGAFDLFIASEEKDKRYINKFMQCAEWAVNHLEPSGAWNNFFFRYPQHPYGAMAQGEGASLLLRAYAHTGDSRYFDSAQKAIDFMLEPLNKNGTLDNNILLEYTHLPAVMNGWIFAWWGLYDYVLVTNDMWKYKNIMDKSCQALEEHLPMFTNNYWSMYDLAGHIASPFYHHLHIAQMQAMYELTGHDIFNQYAQRWQHNEQRHMCRYRAFCVKVLQKIIE